MKKDIVVRLTARVLWPLLIMLAGCGRSQITRFYTLNALTDPQTERRIAESEQGFALGLGPIRLPEYLDRPQIVTRVSPNEVRLSEFHRWAGALADNLSSVLVENLSTLLGTDRVAQYPWKSTTPIDCRVEVEVFRFDGKPGDRVTLQSQWIIFSRDRKQVLAAKASTLHEPVDGKGYDALVSAQSRALAALSREIAHTVVSLPRDALRE